MTNPLIKILEEQPEGGLGLNHSILDYIHKYVDEALAWRLSPMELTQCLGESIELVPIGWQIALRWPYHGATCTWSILERPR